VRRMCAYVRIGDTGVRQLPATDALDNCDLFLSRTMLSTVILAIQ
jgi:hypothetical protein